MNQINCQITTEGLTYYNYCCGDASPNPLMTELELGKNYTGECFCMQNQLNGQSWTWNSGTKICEMASETESAKESETGTDVLASLTTRVTITLTADATATVTATVTTTVTPTPPAK